MAVNFNRKIIFRKPVITKNDEGGMGTTYPADTLTTWASIKRNNQYRALEAQATALIGSDTVIIRYAEDGREDIDKDYLAVYEGKEHVIHSVNVVGRKQIEFIVKSKSHG